MKGKVVAISLLTFSLLVACGDEKEKEKEETSAVTVIGKTIQEESGPPASEETADIKALVNSYSANKETDEKASITSRQLIVTANDGNESVYELPKNEFFVSIAPYINETHPCKDHSLTGCQGELVEKEMTVFIENEKGKVLLNEKLTTLKNGFIDLWLPRNEAFNVKIAYEGKSVEGEITTFDEDGTCITTLQLY